MSGLDPRVRIQCAICRQPFHDPDQAALPGYDYSARTVSDSHRAMFHSGDEQHSQYDPDYYVALDRLEKRTSDYVAKTWAPPTKSRRTRSHDADR